MSQRAGRSTALIFLLGGLIASLLAGRATATMPREFQRLLDAVVRIDVREIAYEDGAERFNRGVGSGVIVSRDGLILTNAHVAGPRAIELSVTLASLEQVRATLVGWDHWTDLALLKLDEAEIERRGLNFSFARLGDSDRLYAGQTVFAVGTPHGLTRTVTRGIISNPQRYFADNTAVRGYETGAFNTWLQTDAAINPGNSGGPLVTEDGQVVGINSRGYVGADNLAFAIPSATAAEVLAKLERDGEITRSYLGIVPGALRDLEGFFRLALNTGMLINSVDPGSPAATAGLRGGDIVLAINEVEIDGRFPEQLPPIQHRIASLPVNSEVRLRVKRAEETFTVTAITEELLSRVGEERLLAGWGLSVRDVSRTYARENQFPDADGVLVIGVQRGFPGEVAGLSRGDVITSINREPVKDLAAAVAAAAQFSAEPAPTLVEARRNFRISLYVLKP